MLGVLGELAGAAGPQSLNNKKRKLVKVLAIRGVAVRFFAAESASQLAAEPEVRSAWRRTGSWCSSRTSPPGGA